MLYFKKMKAQEIDLLFYHETQQKYSLAGGGPKTAIDKSPLLMCVAGIYYDNCLLSCYN